MSRTAEQVAADDALTEAIKATAIAYGGRPDALLLEYVVIGAHRYWADDGEARTIYDLLLRDSDVPVHTAAGLLRFADHKIDEWFADPDGD
jgi:hypothetical protein